MFEFPFLSRDEAVDTAKRCSHYVYVLADTSGVPFYVGKGCKLRFLQHEAEARQTSTKSHKLNKIRKLLSTGAEIRYAILHDAGDEANCLRREMELIRALGRFDLGLGPLTNQTDGGEGMSNPSEESRLKRLSSLGGRAEDPDRRVINEFFTEIVGNQGSVPIKPRTNWSRAEPLTASTKSIGPTNRMAKAIVTSAVANGLMLEPGVPIPRLLKVDGIEFLIENGCGRKMIKAGLVLPPPPDTSPHLETLILTEKGLHFVRRVFSDRRLIELGVLEPA